MKFREINSKMDRDGYLIERPKLVFQYLFMRRAVCGQLLNNAGNSGSCGFNNERDTGYGISVKRCL